MMTRPRSRFGLAAFVAFAHACEAAQSSPAPAADSTPDVVRQALERARPSIVRIDTIGGALPVKRQEGADQEVVVRAEVRQGQGPTTGVVYSPDGYILTSSFNFLRDPSVITVTLSDGRKLLARLRARDRLAGLALLKVDAADLRAATWIPWAEVRPGQRAVGAGFGFATDLPAVSVGIISAVRRLGGAAVQTDARISPAHFGGPLFDIHGRLFGVLIPHVDPDQEVSNIEWYDSGIAFAVHGDYVARRMEQLKAGRDVERGRIGVMLEPAEKPAGMRIAAAPLGPAAQAGLREGDIIVEVCGRDVESQPDVSRALGGMAAGDRARVVYIRDGVRAELDLVLATRETLVPASQPASGGSR